MCREHRLTFLLVVRGSGLFPLKFRVFDTHPALSDGKWNNHDRVSTCSSPTHAEYSLNTARSCLCSISLNQHISHFFFLFLNTFTSFTAFLKSPLFPVPLCWDASCNWYKLFPTPPSPVLPWCCAERHQVRQGCRRYCEMAGRKGLPASQVLSQGCCGEVSTPSKPRSKQSRDLM